MAEEVEVREVQVAELRKGLCSLLREKVPLIVRRNSQPCAVLLSLSGPFFSWSNDLAGERRRLRIALDAVVERLAR
jgi:hypothetical protein